MRSIRRLVLSVGTCAVALVVCAQDEQPTWPKRELKFEVVNQPPGKDDLLRGFAPPATHFRADFSVGDLNFRLPARDDLAKTTAAASFSAEERKLLGIDSSQGSTVSRRSAGMPEDPRLPRYGVCGRNGPEGGGSDPTTASQRTRWGCTVFAVTEADARLLAQAVVEVTDDQRRRWLKSAEDEIAGMERLLDEAPDELAKTEEEIPRLKAVVEQAKAVFPYETGDEAAQDARDLDKTLRNIDVEITGIRARTAAIERFRADPRARQDEARALLDRLQIEEDINLTGATARRASVEAQRKNAVAYRDASVALAKAEAQRKTLKRDMETLPGTLVVKKGELTQRNDLKPLDVIDDTIVIRPVR